MSCLWKTSHIFAVLLAVLCLEHARVSGRKEQTNGHWSVKDSRQTVNLDNAYDIALHLQHKLLKDFKHLKNQMASMQADNAVDQDHLADQSDDAHRHLDTLDWFGRSSESQLLRSKLEDHDSYLRMMTEMFKDQLESIAERIEKNLRVQGEHLERIESRIDALNDTPVADQFAHHEVLNASQKTTDQLIRDIYDAVVAPRDCVDVRATGRNTSGIYRVFPGNVAKRMEAEVFCDMDLDGNGWLVFQQRKSGNVNFERNWTDYANGFGDLTDEFWLGNDLLHALTANRNYKLRIEMEDFEGQKRFAQYANFSVRSSADNYRLLVSSYTGDAGDSLLQHAGAQFSTIDADHDMHNTGSCAELYHGAWWYTSCHASNLNGKYLKGNHTTYADGINWYSFRGHHYSMKTTRMKIAPVSLLGEESGIATREPSSQQRDVILPE